MLSCEQISNNRRVLPQFKFENTWLDDPDFNSFVTDKWRSYGVCLIVDKLEYCASDLTDWSRNNFHNLKREINTCHHKIENEESGGQ